MQFNHAFQFGALHMITFNHAFVTSSTHPLRILWPMRGNSSAFLPLITFNYAFLTSSTPPHSILAQTCISIYMLSIETFIIKVPECNVIVGTAPKWAHGDANHSLLIQLIGNKEAPMYSFNCEDAFSVPLASVGAMNYPRISFIFCLFQ